MRCGNILSFCAWAVLAGCGGTTEPVGPEGSGGASGSGASSGTGGGLSSGGGSSGGGGTKATGGANTGGLATGGTTPGCAPIPAEPVYDCKMRPYQAGDCLPWTPTNAAADRVLGSYPPGCQVSLPQQDAFSRCGPQRCTCQAFPDPSGAFSNDWVCPL
jgi:hypothetical protein